MENGSTEVDRVFVLGDIHGNVDFLRRAATTAAEAGCETILQLGDFGALWPGSRRAGPDVSRLAEATGRVIAAI